MSTSTNPTELEGSDGQKLVFVDDFPHRSQKCIDCWFQWIDTERCQSTPCNSQQRTDGRVGHFAEEVKR